MPTRRAYASRTSRRAPRRSTAYSRTSRRGRRPRSISGGLNLAKTTHSKLRFGDQLAITGNDAGLAALHNYSCNGLFKPDVTGSHTRQPRTYDQMMTFYDHYSVSKAKIICRFSHTEEEPVTVGVIIRDVASTGTLFVQDILEYPVRKFKALAGAGGESFGTVSLSVDIGKFLGRKVAGDPDLKAGVLSNPVEQCYFQIVVWKPGFQAFVNTVSIDLSIDYNVAFIEPKFSSSS